MAITEHDVTRIAKLARIALSTADNHRAQTELNGILSLIEQLQAVDTTGITPMAHPLEVHQDVTLRLRPDEACAAQTPKQRDALMANSPAEQNGLFLVPTVIE